MRLPLLAAVVVAVSIVPSSALAQAPSLPPDVVAQVGTEPITEAELAHWLNSALRGERGPRTVVDRPPHERCVAAELRRRPAQSRPSRRRLRQYCRRRYEQTLRHTMQFVVQAAWVRQEAAAHGVRVTPSQLRRTFERQRRAAFPSRGAFRRFLRRSGSTKADIMYRVELDLLQERLMRTIMRSAPAVTAEDVDAHYANHRQRYRGLSRAEANRAIRRRLTAVRRQRALTSFIEGFRVRMRAATTCAEGYVIAECGATVAQQTVPPTSPTPSPVPIAAQAR